MQNLRVQIYSKMFGSVLTKVFFYIFLKFTPLFVLLSLWSFDLNFDCQSWLFFHPEFAIVICFFPLKNNCIFIFNFALVSKSSKAIELCIILLDVDRKNLLYL